MRGSRNAADATPSTFQKNSDLQVIRLHTLFEHYVAMSPVAGSVHPRISLTFPIELMKLRRVYRHDSPLANTGASPNARFASFRELQHDIGSGDPSQRPGRAYPRARSVSKQLILGPKNAAQKRLGKRQWRCCVSHDCILPWSPTPAQHPDTEVRIFGVRQIPHLDGKHLRHLRFQRPVRAQRNAIRVQVTTRQCESYIQTGRAAGISKPLSFLRNDSENFG